MTPPRTAVVRYVRVDNVGQSSILNAGDAARFQAEADIFALQREVADFAGDEAPLSMFSAFSEPIPEVKRRENVFTSRIHDDPYIRVEEIRVIGVSASAGMFIGSCAQMTMVSRTLNIRHFIQLPKTKTNDHIPMYPIDRFTGIVL